MAQKENSRKILADLNMPFHQSTPKKGNDDREVSHFHYYLKCYAFFWFVIFFNFQSLVVTPMKVPRDEDFFFEKYSIIKKGDFKIAA